MKRVLSGIQPTADSFHLGNYLGALREWVKGQHKNDVFHGIVDLHALTITDTPGVVGRNSLQLAAMLYAVGLDPRAATLLERTRPGSKARTIPQDLLAGYRSASAWRVELTRSEAVEQQLTLAQAGGDLLRGLNRDG